MRLFGTPGQVHHPVGAGPVTVPACGYLDIPGDFLASQLRGLGMVACDGASAGATGDRPPVSGTGGIAAGTTFIDTTLGKTIVFVGGQWLDPATGQAA